MRSPQGESVDGSSPPLAKGRSARAASRVGIGASRFQLTRAKTTRARELRHNSTDVEMKLWQRLRNEQLGVSFRRQHAVGQYILDFYCPALRLAIELDGGQHTASGNAQRDAWFAARDVTTLRFWNSDLVENLSGVLERIAATIEALKRAGMTPSRRWRADLPLSGVGDPRSRQR